MQTRISASWWLRAALLVASGLVLTTVVASVCVESLRPAEPPAPPAGQLMPMDQGSFQQAIQVDRLYEGIDRDFLAPASRVGEPNSIDNLLLSPPTLAAR